MIKKFLPLSATAIAAAIALAGCTTGTGPGSSGTSMPNMDHGSSSAAPARSTPASAADHNAADVMFARMMIPHHAQAVEMSDVMLAKKDIPADVTALATRIKAAQGPEIDTMTGWLKSWNESIQEPNAHDMSTHSAGGMEGMMSDADMTKLDAAQGSEAARLFLNQMIVHHEGAIIMAKTESTAGKNPEAVKLGQAIVTAQEAEIQEMQAMLAKL
ncbi:DUF305 domain-containing protein [Arthrobacter sp. ISL-69]|uniref:DUF305 domain-containing protein n=1 Tax=Arthrobacter sp. ISL-69 TaxID=2819113 RepID=UPI001BE81F65|nr:DUF305 domain-containing protein [Arthrobacter sp. ISL-69]MBT2535676.1 DUF305 domain-containing protein [Arthrobacter sp. ISL-69]